MMWSNYWFRRLLSQLHGAGRSSSEARKARAAGFLPRLEVLEDRWCPSTTAAVIGQGHILQIVGDRSDNQVSIVDHGALGVQVALDGHEGRTFTGIRQVDIRTGD